MSLWDLVQQYQISEARSAAESASRQANRLADNREMLQRDLDKLTLASQAMWEILRDRLGVTDSELKAKIREIDGRDGTIDSRIGAQVSSCPACGKPTSTAFNAAFTRAICSHCGAPVTSTHVMK